MKEQDVVNTAQRAFRETTGGEIKVYNEDKNAIQPFDLMLQIRIHGKKEILLAEVKNEVRMPDLPQLYQQFRTVVKGYNNDHILLAQYIPGPVKEELKKQQVNYLEATGNCFIGLDNIFIFINHQKAAPVRKTITGKLWNKTGLKYVYPWLIYPEFQDLPLRKQAELAGIALGNLPDLKAELTNYQQKLMQDNPQKIREAVKEEWGLQFNKILRNQQLIGRYRMHHKTDWGKLNLPAQTWWGGETAGACLTRYLHTPNIVAYTRNKMVVVKDWKLIPDPNGNVTLYEPFWPELMDENNTETVNPTLVWAELNFDLDQRMRETADRIADKYFKDNDKRLLLLLK
ncbi:MAG: hypothetical protein IT244_10090 [Bacteroidia bacterium]|nr:hypothetical protein [Bacteroidia bacterium]